MKIVKVNESYSYIETNVHSLKKEIIKKLTIEDEAAKFKSKFRKYGMGSDKTEFFKLYNDPNDPTHQNQRIVFPSGLGVFLSSLGFESLKKEPEYSEQELEDFLDSVELTLPFKLFDHQKMAFKDSILNLQHTCISATGSGKSAIVSLICEFLRIKGKKGLVLTPSIDLVNQIHSDFLDYKLQDLYDCTHLIGGENQDKHFNKPLTVGTWQSIMKMHQYLPELDYLIIDECHGLKVDTKALEIVLNSVNAKYRIGLTGTLPEQPKDKMAIFSVAGKPKVYIRTSGLIALGLATPVNINVIKLKYQAWDVEKFASYKDWANQLKFIKEHKNRNKFIASVANTVSSRTGSTVIMTSHVQHGKDIFTEIMKLRAPDVQIEEKDISGKKAFDFQKQYGVYFISGATEGAMRKEIKKILEIDDNPILVSNYQLFSTGINVKKLANILLASPLKSYTTITQSIGRAIRVHVSKDIANVYDFVDMLTNKCVFAKQYEQRKTKSYTPEGFPLIEREVWI